ncbi:MAG: glycosyltransferase family 2 protein [Candidatus Thorarchaeota archaeon]
MYAILMCARNEGGIIAKTLDNILNQTLKPDHIVVVDDGSSDNTPDILEQYKENYDVVVLRRKDRGYSAVSSYDMANVYNLGLRFLKSKKWEHLFIVPADMKLPESYAERLINNMKGYGVASGVPDRPELLNNFNSDFPIGGGRMIKRDVFDYLSGVYPVNYDYESSVIHCARFLGYSVGHFKDITYSLDRIQGKGHPTKYIEWGRAMKDANYHPLYTLGRALKEIIVKHRLKRGLQFLIGFLAQPSSDYPDYSIYLYGHQKNQVILAIKRLLIKAGLY